MTGVPIKGILYRKATGDQGTPGQLLLPDFSCFTLEPPDRNNQPNVSCMPEGVWDLMPVWSKHFHRILYGFVKIPGRKGLLAHNGNLAGNVEKGLRSQSNGCVLLGYALGAIAGQLAVLRSLPALMQFMSYMELRPLRLEIVNGYR